MATVLGPPRFPRLYAAASLKPRGGHLERPRPRGFPRLYAAASLKPGEGRPVRPGGERVFRGFMPRPH